MAGWSIYIYIYGVLILGVLGSRVMIVVPLYWYIFGEGWGYLLNLLGYGLGLVTSSSLKLKP
jgi:hypothetical protein